MAPTHYYAAKLMKVHIKLLRALADGYKNREEEALAQGCWHTLAAKLRTALKSSESSFGRFSDDRAELLIDQGRVMQRLGEQAKVHACLKEARQIIQAIHWPCGETTLQGDEQKKNPVRHFADYRKH